jgi:hypothetical protein
MNVDLRIQLATTVFHAVVKYAQIWDRLCGLVVVNKDSNTSIKKCSAFAIFKELCGCVGQSNYIW